MSKIVEVLLKRVDLKGLLMEDVLEAIIFKKLEEMVASSTNTLDDAGYAMLKPILVEGLEEYIDSALASLAAPAEPVA